MKENELKPKQKKWLDREATDEEVLQAAMQMEPGEMGKDMEDWVSKLFLGGR